MRHEDIRWNRKLSNGSVPSVAARQAESRRKMLWINWRSTSANFLLANPGKLP